MKWSVELYGLWPNRAEWNARRISLSLHIFQRAGCRSPWPLAVFWNENSRLEPIPSLPPDIRFKRLSNPSSLANPFKSFPDTIVPIFVSNLVLQLLQTISSLIENSIKCKEFRSERRKVPRSLNFQRSKFNNKNSSIPELIISRAKKDAVGERQVICRKCRIRNRGDRTWPPPPAKYSIARVRNSRVLFDTDQPGPGRDSLGVYVTRAVHGGMVVFLPEYGTWNIGFWVYARQFPCRLGNNNFRVSRVALARLLCFLCSQRSMPLRRFGLK